MNTIICKSCGAEIEITEALTHQIADSIRVQEEEKYSAKLKNVEKSLSEQLEKKIKEEQLVEMKTLKDDLERKNHKLEEFQEQELKLREEKRLLEEREKELKLEVERQIDAKRKDIEEKVLKEEEEKHKLKEKEKDMQIDNLKRMLDDAQRKASQASQQIQGEVLEIELEEQLKRQFPHDEVSPVGKGRSGGDILQVVRNSQGKSAGSILWETKRANWSPAWLAKLREDGREVGATITILVSEALPKDISNFDLREGVIITSYPCALALAGILRRNIMLIASAKSAAAHKDEKMELLYTYLQSDTFRHRFEAYAEGVVEMQRDLETEKRSAIKIWKKREMQINKSLDNIASIWGELQGIVGESSLPDIKILSLSDGVESLEAS